MTPPLEDDRPADEWAPAPPGKVAALARKVRGRRQRRVFVRSAAATTAALVASGGLWLWRSGGPGRGGDLGGLTCAEAQRLAPAFVKGELVDPLRERVRRHAIACPVCRPLFEQLGYTFTT